jgi:hypothetical protein
MYQNRQYESKWTYDAVFEGWGWWAVPRAGTAAKTRRAATERMRIIVEVIVRRLVDALKQSWGAFYIAFLTRRGALCDNAQHIRLAALAEREMV